VPAALRRSTSSSSPKKTTCAGIRSASSWPWPCRWKTSASRTATRAKLLAKTLDAATGKLLDNNKSPSPRTGELDNRGSQFYLAMYWAQELANQTEDLELAAHFAKLAKALTDSEAQIVAELKTVQGKPVDIGGYYKADSEKCKAVMRPSPTLNAALKAARV
jgi:isocitrate dehydrogenase